MNRSVQIEIRQDGIHVIGTDPNAYVGLKGRVHHIILRLFNEGSVGHEAIPEPIKIRLLAFSHVCCTTTSRPDLLQKKLEKDIGTNGYNLFGSVEDIYRQILGQIQDAIHRQKRIRLDSTRSALRAAVNDAHELLSAEEIETICKEALIESVLRS